jgi:biopolymer transport protein ExbB/TolQ
MLTAFGLLMVATIVFGIFKVIAQGKQIKNLEGVIDSIESSINRRIDEFESSNDQRLNHIEDRIDRSVDTLMQHIDAREKDFESRINRTIDRNENVTHKKLEDLKRSLTEEQINS